MMSLTVLCNVVLTFSMCREFLLVERGAFPVNPINGCEDAYSFELQFNYFDFTL